MTDLLQEAILYYREHPYEYVIDQIEGATPSPQQTQVLKRIPQAIREGKSIAVKAGHGVGKTAEESWIILWYMSVFPHPTILCTAPAKHTLYDVLWAELSKWHQKCKFRDMFEWTRTAFQHKDHPETWAAAARTSNKPESLAGRHGEHVLIIIDEASGVPQDVMEVVEGSQTQEGALIMMFGNPTQISGGFYDAFHSKRSFFETFTFNSEDAVEFLLDNGTPLVKKSYCERIAAKYGRDSDVYRVRVLGEFPKSEPDTLISLSVIEAAASREKELPEAYEIVELGVDCARFGDDESVIYRRIGNDIELVSTLRKRDLMYLTGEIVRAAKQFSAKTVLINIDDSGLGGGVTDRLKELVAEGSLKATIIPVLNNRAPRDGENYANLVTEMWDFMKGFLATASITNDNDLIGQLSTRKYGVNSKGQMIIESKDQMKKRGLTSPDRADGAILTLYSLIYGVWSAGARAYAC